MPTQHDVSVERDLVVQWMGDISLNGLFCNPQNHASVSENMAALARGLGTCDLRIGNWESPLWGDGGVNVLKYPRLCTTADAAKCVLPLGLDVALLANNHTYDCLEKGFENTIRFLDENGIEWLGAGTTESDAAKPLIINRGNRRIGLVDYVAPDTHPNIPEGAGVYVNWLEEKRVLGDVTRLVDQVDIVLVHFHWGIDWTSYPTLAQRRQARAVIEAGATAVVGHHAHFLQGHEPWNTGHVFYGLGNFIFENLDDKRRLPELSRRAAVARCTISHDRAENAGLVHVHQHGLTLELDNQAIRSRQEQRLNRPLRFADARYSCFYHRYQLYRTVVVKPLHQIKDSGGVLRALARLRWRHLAEIIHLLICRRDPRATKQGNA